MTRHSKAPRDLVPPFNFLSILQTSMKAHLIQSDDLATALNHGADQSTREATRICFSGKAFSDRSTYHELGVYDCEARNSSLRRGAR